jgi:hypothetical protein
MSPRAVFVIGCPRSGTSLVGGLIGRHPMVFNAEESLFLYLMSNWSAMLKPPVAPLTERFITAASALMKETMACPLLGRGVPTVPDRERRPRGASPRRCRRDAVGTGRDLVSVRGGGGSLQGTSGICRGPLRGPLPSTCTARPRAPAEARASLGRECVGSVLDPRGVDVVQSAARADVRLGLGVPQARPRGLHAEPRGPACHRRVGPTAANRPRLRMAGPNQRR